MVLGSVKLVVVLETEDLMMASPPAADLVMLGTTELVVVLWAV